MRQALIYLSVCCLAWTVQAETLDGELIQGGLVYGTVTPGSVVTLDGKAVPVTSDGRFVLGFDRDAKSDQMLQAEGKSRTLKVTSREYRIQRIEGIAKQIMDPSDEDLVRIRKDSAQTRAARAARDLRTDFDSGFVWPLQGPISGVYGSQRVYNGRPSRPHYGVDIAAPSGTPVYAPAKGVITLAHGDMFYSGGTIILDHGLGLSSSFLHLSKVLVDVGAAIQQGDLIGEVGASGRATGPHLDWRMNWLDTRIDPQRLVGEMLVEAAKSVEGGHDNAR